MTTITLNSNQLAILRALVERAALDTPLGLDADEDTEAYLRHANADQRTLSRFVSKAREALKDLNGENK